MLDKNLNIEAALEHETYADGLKALPYSIGSDGPDWPDYARMFLESVGLEEFKRWADLQAGAVDTDTGNPGFVDSVPVINPYHYNVFEIEPLLGIEHSYLTTAIDALTLNVKFLDQIDYAVYADGKSLVDHLCALVREFYRNATRTNNLWQKDEGICVDVFIDGLLKHLSYQIVETIIDEPIPETAFVEYDDEDGIEA
jgi:hypothetical protein